MSILRRIISIALISITAIATTGCGDKVEVPPAHVAKVVSESGYQEGIITTSKFRLSPCLAYCDKLVTLNVSDQRKVEPVQVFMPQDKLVIEVDVQTTLSVDPKKTEALFTSLVPSDDGDGNNSTNTIKWDSIYDTYAKNIINAETREFLSKYSIAELSSNLEVITTQLRTHLTKVISQRTPFTVRYVGLSKVKYPDVITKAQEGAAKRREEIQTEEAQLQISKVKLERELQEARLTRQIEFEKAQTEAAAFKTQAQSITPEVLKKQELDNQAAWIDKWDGVLPGTVTADVFGAINQAPRK